VNKDDYSGYPHEKFTAMESGGNAVN